MGMRSFKVFGLAALVAIGGASLTSTAMADPHHNHNYGNHHSYYGNHGPYHHHNHWHPPTGYYGYRPHVLPYPNYGYGYSSYYGGYNGIGTVPRWGGYGVGSFPRGGSYGGGGFSLYIGR